MLAYVITQVWQIRINVHFVNDEGNMLDCASIACIAALRHFRKPEVTVEGTEVTVVSATTTVLPDSEGLLQHSLEERVPVPLALSHSPYCVTFASFGAV